MGGWKTGNLAWPAWISTQLSSLLMIKMAVWLMTPLSQVWTKPQSSALLSFSLRTETELRPLTQDTQAQVPTC